MLNSAHRFFEGLRLRTGAKLSFNQKRLCVGVAFSAAALCLANYELDWSMFGSLNSKKVFIGSMVLLAIVVHFVGPTLQDIYEYRDRKRGQ
jgi:hypothetical protein